MVDERRLPSNLSELCGGQPMLTERRDRSGGPRVCLLSTAKSRVSSGAVLTCSVLPGTRSGGASDRCRCQSYIVKLTDAPELTCISAVGAACGPLCV